MPAETDNIMKGEVADSFLFTSESVSEGHPDKLCDIISDCILDECLRQDPNSVVACETVTTTGLVMILGEITSNARMNYDTLVRDAIKKIGYTDGGLGMDYKSCNVLTAIGGQSPDIAQGVHANKFDDNIGAGDQGQMFGYATNETPEMMPMTHVLATKLTLRLTEARKDGTLPWLGPDSKSQVTMEYTRNGCHIKPKRVHTIVISAQHLDSVTNEEIRKAIREKIINPVIPSEYLDENTIYHLNPSGRFVIGGPQGDAGLTGRKIIIDTYGGWGAHGGGAFSGKDPSKVDRSGAYCARWIAKSLVAAELCDRCLVQISYSIGVAKPLSVHVDCYGTAVKSEHEIVDIIMKNFDLRPGVITRILQLRRPIYMKTAAGGHFGRDDEDFLWEKPLTLKL